MTMTAVYLFCLYFSPSSHGLQAILLCSSLIIGHWLRQPDCQSHSRGQPTCLFPFTAKTPVLLVIAWIHVQNHFVFASPSQSPIVVHLLHCCLILLANPQKVIILIPSINCMYPNIQSLHTSVFQLHSPDSCSYLAHPSWIASYLTVHDSIVQLRDHDSCFSVLFVLSSSCLDCKLSYYSWFRHVAVNYSLASKNVISNNA